MIKHYRDKSGTVWKYDQVRAREREEFPEVVVIDGPLPEVTDKGGAFVRAGMSSVMRNDDPALIELVARNLTALAAYLREHPPVDEAQVKALITDLENEWRADNTRAMARDLVALGWTNNKKENNND